MTAFSVDINAETAKRRHNGAFADSDFSCGNIGFYMKGKESLRRIFIENSGGNNLFCAGALFLPGLENEENVSGNGVAVF